MTKLSLNTFTSLSPEKQKELDKLKSLQEQALEAEKGKQENTEKEGLHNQDQPITKDDVLKAMRWFVKTYPKLFSKDFDKPLMTGVDKAAFKDQGDNLPFTKTLMRKGLRMYVNHPKYLQALVEQSHRFTLQGDKGEPIDPEHKKQAQDRIQQRIQNRKENKKKPE